MLCHPLFMALLATSASAQSTVSLWMIGGRGTENTTLTGSVIAQNSDRTTVSFQRPETTYTRDSPPFTFAGLTYLQYTGTAPDPYGRSEDVTVAVTCTRTEVAAAGTCYFSTRGVESSLSAECSLYANSALHTTTYTVAHPSESGKPLSTRIITITEDYRSTDPAPAYCSESSIPESAKISSATFEGTSAVFMQTYQLVLTTAASAVATPTPTPASSTSSVSEKTAAPSGGAADSGARLLPAFAGMGAAVALFL